MGWRRRCGWRRVPPRNLPRVALVARAPGTCLTIFWQPSANLWEVTCELPPPALPPEAVKADIAQLIGDILPVGCPKPQVNRDREHLPVWKRGRGWGGCPPGSKILPPRQTCCFSSCKHRFVICFPGERRQLGPSGFLLAFDLELAPGEPDGTGR